MFILIEVTLEDRDTLKQFREILEKAGGISVSQESAYSPVGIMGL